MSVLVRLVSLSDGWSFVTFGHVLARALFRFAFFTPLYGDIASGRNRILLHSFAMVPLLGFLQEGLMGFRCSWPILEFIVSMCASFGS